jgi:hypothetical protein
MGYGRTRPTKSVQYRSDGNGIAGGHGLGIGQIELQISCRRERLRRTAPQCGRDLISGGLDRASDHNLIGDGYGGLSSANHNLLGTSANPINPLLAPLGNYGGPTQTTAPAPKTDTS